MGNLEHLIENTLVAMEDDKLCPEDIRKRIRNDVNLPYTALSVDDVWEICQYVKYTWCANMRCEVESTDYLSKDEVLKAIDQLPLIAESKVETTLSGDKKLDNAIKYLHKQYDKALKMDYIKNSLAWALYQTWRYVDKGNGTRT